MSTPEVFFRETIDLNRYSNAVSNKFVENYIQVIYDAAEQLVKLDIRQKAAPAGVVIAPQTRNRLRSIIAQSKSSMNRWSKDATRQMIKEIETTQNGGLTEREEPAEPAVAAADTEDE